MMSFLRYALWLAIAAGVIYGSYYAYQNWWNEGTAEKISSEAETLGKQAGQIAGDYAGSVASTTKAAAGSFIKGKIGDLVSVIGEELYSIGLNLSGATSSLPVSNPAVSALPAGNVPAPTSTAYDVPPPPATIMVGINEPLSFSVNSGQVYKADWGDGKNEQGATAPDNITVLHHAWAEAGDYIVRMSVGNSVSSNIYSFPIRVY